MPELPSGLRLYLAKLSIIDFQGRTDWFRCPPGHFWFMTPNLSLSSPPFSPTDEIIFDFLSAPVPTTRQEAAEFVQVLVEDRDHGIYWRGDWLDTFETTFDLAPEDRAAWRAWLPDNLDLLDIAISASERQAASNQNMTGSYTKFPGEYMIYMTIPAHSIGKEIVPSRIQPYALSQLMERKHKLPESVKQLDYEVAVNHVAADLQDHGYRTPSANRDRSACPSLIAQSATGALAVRVCVSRAPDEALCSEADIAALKNCLSTDITQCGIARVGLLPALPRSPEGNQGFHLKYAGIERLP